MRKAVVVHSSKRNTNTDPSQYSVLKAVFVLPGQIVKGAVGQFQIVTGISASLVTIVSQDRCHFDRAIYSSKRILSMDLFSPAGGMIQFAVGSTHDTKMHH